MKITDFEVYNATNYFTIFECSKEDKMRLLSYVSWLLEFDITEKILADKKFSPSEQWQEWLMGNYVAFSEKNIMYKSGHKFYHSYAPFFFPAYNQGSLWEHLKLIYAAVRRWAGTENASPIHSQKLFLNYYPETRIPEIHDVLIKYHHGAYFRALESNALVGDVGRDVILEIGAGSAINPILNFLQYGSTSIIIDLPETISIAFALSKACAPGSHVALPNDVQMAIEEGETIESLIEENDFIFMLPTQTGILSDNLVDLAFNTASFQEMEISVVRNYIAMIYQCLKPAGSVALLNLEVSREIEGNSMSDYGLECFANGKFFDANFANTQIPSLKSLKYMCFVGNK